MNLEVLNLGTSVLQMVCEWTTGGHLDFLLLVLAETEDGVLGRRHHSLMCCVC